MGISYNPSIVTEGLVLALDPQNTRSYVGSGTTWTDLTNNGNSGTLTNGPVFIPGGPFNNSGGSVYLDGTGDYLTAGSASDWTFLHNGSSFTAECWFYTASTSAATLLSTSATQYNPGFNFDINQGSAGVVRFVLYKGTLGNLNVTSSASSFSVNTWNHVAAVYNSSTTTLTLYINGVSAGTADGSSFAFSSSDSSYTLGVGRYQHSTPGGYVDGYISNVRLVNGTALYTGAFTPSTGPLEAIDDTVLLTCQGGAITDNGPSSHAITVNGDAEAITASAFDFDGSNDYAVTSSNTDFLFGTEEFAIEWWEYFTDGTGYAGHIGVFEHGGGNDTAHIWTVSGSFHGYPGSWTSIAMQPISNQWAHYVVTGTSGNIKFYQNSELKDTKNWDWSATSSTANFAVGGTPGWSYGNYAMAGKISAVKVYKGKSFTEDEVKRNFSALRGRYGI